MRSVHMMITEIALGGSVAQLSKPGVVKPIC